MCKDWSEKGYRLQNKFKNGLDIVIITRAGAGRTYKETECTDFGKTYLIDSRLEM